MVVPVALKTKLERTLAGGNRTYMTYWSYRSY